MLSWIRHASGTARPEKPCVLHRQQTSNLTYVVQICGESNIKVFEEAAAAGVPRVSFISVHDYGLPGNATAWICSEVGLATPPLSLPFLPVALGGVLFLISVP